MQDIKYIKRIVQEIKQSHYVVGNTIYFTLGENRAKTYCEEMGVRIEIINPRSGKIDHAFLPFSQYFTPVKTTEGASEFSQRIGNDGKWWFEETYPHTLPKSNDYKNIAKAMVEYMHLFKI